VTTSKKYFQRESPRNDIHFRYERRTDTTSIKGKTQGLRLPTLQLSLDAVCRQAPPALCPVSVAVLGYPAAGPSGGEPPVDPTGGVVVRPMWPLAQVLNVDFWPEA
jgi:hypothetical protein